jgi:glycosyltransferase involved in cell wall biosynthesis
MPTSPDLPAPNVLPKLKFLPKLNILQVIPELDAGGAERTTVDVAKGILAAGGKAVVATRGGRLQSQIEEAGGTVITLPVHSKNPLTMLLNIFRLRRIIRTHDIDLIHVRSRAPAWSALAAARLTGISYVTTYHGTYNAKSSLKRFYNSGMARGDQVIANSDFIAARIQDQHAGLATNLTIIPRGTDLAVFDEAAIDEPRKETLRKTWSIEDNTAPLILLPGRLTAWKGQGVLIDAAAELVQRGIEDFMVIFVGDPQGRDDYVKSLWDKIRDEDLSEKVRLAGHCSDMPAAMALADIVVSASTDPEAFGRIAVEAQAMKRIIIASDHGGAEETVQVGANSRTGWRVKPGDAGALAGALEAALKLPREEKQKVVERGRENAKTFSVEAMVASTLEVYGRAVDQTDG